MLFLFDDFTRMSFVYPITDKSQYSVAAALEEHFLQQRPTSTGIKGVNFFINRMVLSSDRGTELINSSVHDLCERLGCNIEYSCPGQLRKYQKGLVERRITEIGRIARCSTEMSGVPDLASRRQSPLADMSLRNSIVDLDGSSYYCSQFFREHVTETKV